MRIGKRRAHIHKGLESHSFVDFDLHSSTGAIGHIRRHYIDPMTQGDEITTLSGLLREHAQISGIDST